MYFPQSSHGLNKSIIKLTDSLSHKNQDIETLHPVMEGNLKVEANEIFHK